MGNEKSLLSSALGAFGGLVKTGRQAAGTVARFVSDVVVTPKDDVVDRIRGKLPESVQKVVGKPDPADTKRANKQHRPYGITFYGEGSDVNIGAPRYVLSKKALHKFAAMQDAIPGDGSRLMDHSKKTGVLDAIGDHVPIVGDALNEIKDTSKRVAPKGQNEKDFDKLQALREELRAKGGKLHVDLSNPAVPCVRVDIDIAGKSEEELKAEFRKVLKGVCGVESKAAVNAEFNRFMQQAKEVGNNTGISQDTSFTSVPAKESPSPSTSSPMDGPGGGRQPSRGVASDKDVFGGLGPQTLMQQTSSEETVVTAGAPDKGTDLPKDVLEAAGKIGRDMKNDNPIKGEAPIVNNVTTRQTGPGR